MNREEYLQELWGRLSGKLPPRELESVVAYYSEYFDEAGSGREAEIIEELGPPERLAREILGEQALRTLETPPEQGRPRRGLGTVWTVLLAIFAAPIAIPLALALAAVAFALVIAAVALVAGVGVAGAACVAAGVFAAFCGVHVIFSSGIATTIFFVGGGMAAAGIGVLLLAAASGIAGLCFAGIARLLGRAFRRSRREVSTCAM